MERPIWIKKRSYIEAFKEQKDSNYLEVLNKTKIIFKSKIIPYENENYNNKKFESLITYKIAQLGIDIQYDKMQINGEDFIILLIRKILAKFNFYYLQYLKFAPQYLEYKKKFAKKANIPNSSENNYTKNLNNKDKHTKIENNSKSKGYADKEPYKINNQKNYILNTYVNEQLYPLIRNFKNINPNNVIIIDVIGDGNCLFRALAQFIYGNEYMYKNIRQSIYSEAINRIRVIPNVIIQTERRSIHMHDYINTINEDGIYEGDIEISLAYNIFNINIGEYIEIR